jgi:hypothetical protein
MEHFTEYLKVFGPWVLSLVGAILAKLLHKAIKGFRSLGETTVKADLAFEEVSERVPEIKRRYDTWAAHR